MIRRLHGSDFLLITQHDHALISGEIVYLFGNQRFAAPNPFQQTIRGISLHDCGWPLHDDEPTLNAEHFPLDVFESPREIALKVWTASADRAAAQDPYSGLLVSLHVLALSVFATTPTSFAHEKFEDPASKFAVAKFQQHELERQEKLRAQLGLRTEKTGHHAAERRDIAQKAEDQLQSNFRLLQAMDQISLAACCTKPPQDQTRDILARPGDTDTVKLSLVRRGDDLTVVPWPFTPPEIELKIPASRLPARPYRDQADLRQTLAAAQSELITCRVLPG